MFDRFAARDPGQDVRLFMLALGRKDHPQRFADGFRRGVAEDFFRAPVPARDDARQRFADDGIVGRSHDGRQFDLLLFKPLALGDVTGKTTIELLAVKPHIGRHDFDRKLAAILATMDGFTREECRFPQAFPDSLKALSCGTGGN